MKYLFFLLLLILPFKIGAYGCCSPSSVCSSWLEIYCCNQDYQIDSPECVSEIYNFYMPKYNVCYEILNKQYSSEKWEECLKIIRKYRFWFKVIKDLNYQDSDWKSIFDFTQWNALNIFNFEYIPSFLQTWYDNHLVYKNVKYRMWKEWNILECNKDWKLLYWVHESSLYFICDENALLKYSKFDQNDLLNQKFYLWKAINIKWINFDFSKMTFRLNLINESWKPLRDSEWFPVDWLIDWKIKNNWTELEFYLPQKYEWIDWEFYYLDSSIKKIRINIYEKQTKKQEIKIGNELKSFYLSSVYPYYVDLKLQWTEDTFNVNQFYLERHNLDKAWEQVRVSRSSLNTVIVAVIDEWVSFLNKDLNKKYWINKKEIRWNWKDDDWNWYIDDYYWWNFIDNTPNVEINWAHWTNVAWIISAIHNNNYWLKWISENAIIMPLVVADSKSENAHYKEIDAIKWIIYAVDNWAKIINLSLAWPYYEWYSEAIKYANDKWVIVVVAAWNNNINVDNVKISPVCNDLNNKWDIIWVGWLDKNWSRTSFSNYWSCIDFWSYWDDIFTTPLDWYSEFDVEVWTSFSSPIITWIIALWLWVNDKLWSKEIYNALLKSLKWNVVDADKFIEIIRFDYKNFEQKIKDDIIKPLTKMKFSDIDESTSEWKASLDLSNKWIIGWYPDWTFKWWNNVNRAEIVKFLVLAKYWTNFDTSYYTWNLKYKTLLKDVDQNAWYAWFVNKAVMQNIIWWYSDWTYKPANTVNTAEFLKMLSKTFYLEENLDYSSYSDIKKEDWFSKHAWVALKYNLFPNRNWKLNPWKMLTRKEVAIAIYNYLSFK